MTGAAEKRADRQVLALLYAAPVPAIGVDGELERTQIVASLGDEGMAADALERLRRDRLIELLGPAGGPYSYRLSPAARACLNAVGRL